MKKAIVTVCRNSGTTIERTFQSVDSELQITGESLNYIVIDGGSTDSTLEIIKKWKAKGLVNTWVSEPDEGIYDAMNKGISLLSDDEYAVFLNSDDELHKGALKALHEAYSERPAANYFFGNAKIIGRDKTFIQKGNLHKLAYCILCNHQTLWVKGGLLKKLKGFRLDIGLAADADLMYRLVKIDSSGHKVEEQCLSQFHLGGATTKENQAALNFLKVQLINHSTISLLYRSSPKFKHTFIHGFFKRLRRYRKFNQEQELKILCQLADLILPKNHFIKNQNYFLDRPVIFLSLLSKFFQLKMVWRTK